MNFTMKTLLLVALAVAVILPTGCKPTPKLDTSNHSNPSGVSDQAADSVGGSGLAPIHLGQSEGSSSGTSETEFAGLALPVPDEGVDALPFDNLCKPLPKQWPTVWPLAEGWPPEDWKLSPVMHAILKGSAQEVNVALRNASTNGNRLSGAAIFEHTPGEIEEVDARAANVFHYAAWRGDKAVFEELLKHLGGRWSYLSYYRFDVDGLLPLHYAILKGNNEVASLLVNVSYVSTMDPKIEANPGVFQSVLGNPLQSGNKRVPVDEKEIQPEDKMAAWRRHGLTPLHLAVITGNLRAVQMLMTPAKRDRSDMFGESRVFLANGPDSMGNTPLLYAVSHGQVEIAKFLLQAKEFPQETANSLMKNHSGVSAFRLAVRNNLPAFIDLMIGANTKIGQDELNEAVLFASAGGNAEALQALLIGGATAFAADSSGLTPLHVAALKGTPEIVKILLAMKEKPIVNATTISGHTPLHFACRKGNEVTTKLLLESGAKSGIRVPGSLKLSPAERDACLPSMAKTWGMSPLDIAIASKNHAVEQLLRAHNQK